MVQTNGAGPTSETTGAHAVHATISEGIVVTGNVACAGNLQISGRVDGEVRGRTIFVDEKGVVTGAIAADQLRVCGTVTGELMVTDLAIEAGGSVAGDVSYQRLKVASGAVLQGNLSHRAGSDEEAVTRSADDTSLRVIKGSVAPVNPRHVFAD